MKNQINYLHTFYFLPALALCFITCSKVNPKNMHYIVDDLIIRIAELEIDSAYLNEYTTILKEEADASVRLEPGVICIYPMFEIEKPTEIRLLEIYANKVAYESHLQTPHFLKYKTTTQEMVKSLRLVEMDAINPESMPAIFTKIKGER